MYIAIVIALFVLVLWLGLYKLNKQYRLVLENHEFAFTFREKFIEMTNIYFSKYDSYSGRRHLDQELYMWLTKNVNRMQGDLGNMGTMHFVAPYRTYSVRHYQIIINTIPKYRMGNVEDFEVNSVDDCLLRYLGVMEKAVEATDKRRRNPAIWFKEGIQGILSLPIYILNWFGIIGDNLVSKIISNLLFRIITGIGALAAFISSIVTVIQGKDQTISFFQGLFHR